MISILAHLYAIAPYAYEVIGGLLILMSSAVSETCMPQGQRRRHWIFFACVAVLFSIFGVAVRHTEVQQSIEDRKELKSLRGNSDNLITSFNATFPLVVSLNGAVTGIKQDLVRLKATSNPSLVADLQRRADVAQRLSDSISKDALIAMSAPLAEQITNIAGVWYENDNAIDNRFYDDIQREHDPKKQVQLQEEGKLKRADWHRESQAKLKAPLDRAEFLRQEMLRRIGSSRQTKEDHLFAKGLGDTEISQAEGVGTYLQDLAKRLAALPEE